MAKIIDINGRPAKPAELEPKPKPQTGQPMTLPTAQEIAVQLNQLLGSLMQIFRQNGIPGFHIVSIGKILAHLRFVEDEKQLTPLEVEMMVRKQAEAQLEDMRVWLLKQSVTSNSKLN